MADPLGGISFSPNNQGGPMGKAGQSGQAGVTDTASPIQQAIRILSLRIPRVVSQGAPINQSLLSGPGSAGLNTGGLSLDELLRRLFGVQPGGQVPALPAQQSVGSPQSAIAAMSQPAAPSWAPSPSAAPSPLFTPGINPGAPTPGNPIPTPSWDPTQTTTPAPAAPPALSGGPWSNMKDVGGALSTLY